MRKSLKKSLIYSIVGIAAVACTNIAPEPLHYESVNALETLRMAGKPSFRPPAPNDDKLVIQADTLKGSEIKIERDSAVQIFNFYPITPPDIYFNFPSHSIVMIPVDKVGIDTGVANSYCEYWLFTKAGELVCYCKNTVSGLHPVYANNFNHNNHLEEFRKKIGYGEYRLVYKNISKVPVIQDLIFGLIINYGKDQIDTKVRSGETKEFRIKIYPSDSEFKMNNNNKIPS